MTVSDLSPGLYKFRLTVTDDADQTGSAEVSVLVLTPEQSLREYMKTQQQFCVYFIYLLTLVWLNIFYVIKFSVSFAKFIHK